MVTKLGLKTEALSKPYNLCLLQDGEGMIVTERCLIPFFTGKTYYDEIWCDVMNMSACHLLLGRPWVLHPIFLYGCCSLIICSRTLCICMIDINESIYL